MLGILAAILPVFIVVGFGYVAVRYNLFADSAVEGLMKFSQNFAIPALLFRAMSTLEIGAAFTPSLFLSYYGGATLSFLVALVGARLLFARPWEDSIAIGFSGLFANGLLLGVPVTEQAFGPQATEGNFVIISVNSLYCYGIGITAMEIARARRSGGTLSQLPGRVLKAMFRNAMILGIMSGLAVNASGATLPVVLTDALDLMARAALPAALFGLGGVLCHYRPEGDLRTIALIVLASLFIHPAATWIIGTVSSLPEAGFRSAVTMAAMAPGVNTYIFANMYGTARRVVASAVLIGTAVSLFTTWAWLALLH
jgi:malonate transporter